MERINVKIIGLGGIGTYLTDPLFRYLNTKNDISIYATLIDGDMFELKNIDRQNFVHIDNYKAIEKRHESEMKFQNIKFDSITEYINSINISQYIDEGDYIFLCVDNHKTRKIVNDYVETLSNVILISGGNEYTDGNVQVFIKSNGQKILPSLTDYHPEISNFNDQTPEEMSCEELQNSAPQLIFTNLFASTIMVSAFYNIFEYGSINNISEIYFDIVQLSVAPKQRKVK